MFSLFNNWQIQKPCLYSSPKSPDVITIIESMLFSLYWWRKQFHRPAMFFYSISLLLGSGRLAQFGVLLMIYWRSSMISIIERVSGWTLIFTTLFFAEYLSVCFLEKETQPWAGWIKGSPDNKWFQKASQVFPKWKSQFSLKLGFF